MHESNINQTVVSAAASIISGGLVAPIPAYTLLTGNQLGAWPMIAWVFSVSFLGIWIAWYLRPSLLNDKALKLPEGMATLETLLHIYNHGREAATRLKVLLSAALLSGLVKWVDIATWKAVAQTLTHGLDSLSASIRWAIAIAGMAGVLLGVLDSLLPARHNGPVLDGLSVRRKTHLANAYSPPCSSAWR